MCVRDCDYERSLRWWMDSLAAVVKRQRGEEGTEREDGCCEKRGMFWMSYRQNRLMFCGSPSCLMCPWPPWPPPNNLT